MSSSLQNQSAKIDAISKLFAPRFQNLTRAVIFGVTRYKCVAASALAQHSSTSFELSKADGRFVAEAMTNLWTAAR